MRLALLAPCAAVLLAGGLPALAQADPDQETLGKRAGGIAETPLKDTNLVKTKIPPLLQKVVRDPYALDGIKTCAQVAAAVRDLDGVLGRDVDAGTTPGKRSMGSEVAEGGARDAIAGLIPGRSIVRLVSGADANERRAAAAINAGNVRRGFLKGYGQARGCKAPAAPLHGVG